MQAQPRKTPFYASEFKLAYVLKPWRVVVFLWLCFWCKCAIFCFVQSKQQRRLDGCFRVIKVNEAAMPITRGKKAKEAAGKKASKVNAAASENQVRGMGNRNLSLRQQQSMQRNSVTVARIATTQYLQEDLLDLLCCLCFRKRPLRWSGPRLLLTELPRRGLPLSTSPMWVVCVFL